MSKISMVMFDLSGTTVYDDTGVRDCLYKAAQEFELKRVAGNSGKPYGSAAASAAASSLSIRVNIPG